MSDDIPSYMINSFFEEEYDIKNRKNQHVAKIFASKTKNPNVIGNVYMIHGYGGSIMEPCLYDIKENALELGFNVIGIETDCMSAMNPEKKADEMTLDNHKSAIFHSLVFCKNNKEFKSNNNIVFAHSMGGRALADLVLKNKKLKEFFNTYYFLNPYFMTPPKLLKIKGTPVWDRFKNTPQKEYRTIRGVEYMVFKRILNYDVAAFPPFDNMTMTEMTETISKGWGDVPVHFVLGGDDLPSYKNYETNYNLVNLLNIPNKSMHIIAGADHFFDNTKSEYHKFLKTQLQKPAQIIR